jgi:hypothetical protein
MIPVLLVTTALAETPVWWTEEGVSSRSELFGKAQARDAQAYEAAQDQLSRARRAVGDLELADALLPPDAARSAYVAELDRSLSGQFLRLQRHTDLLSEDYARTFGAAVSRAVVVVANGRSVVECTSVSAVERAMGKGPRCPGTDISAKIASTIDEDVTLRAEVASLLSVDWPTVTVTGRAQPAAAFLGDARTLSVATIARTLRKDELRELDDIREAAIEQLEEDLASTDRATKEAAVKKGRAIAETWRKSVAEVGAGLWPEVKKKLEKGKRKGAPVDVALCANPESLGGCGLPDATKEAIAALTPE